MPKMSCNLIVAEQPTINGRVYSKEVMQDMHSQMMELINKDQLLIYHNSMPDFTQQIKSPTFDKAVGKVVDCKLTNIFEFDVENIHTEYSKCVDFSNTELILIPVVTGEVKRNEVTNQLEVSDVKFDYLNLGIKGN